MPELNYKGEVKKPRCGIINPKNVRIGNKPRAYTSRKGHPTKNNPGGATNKAAFLVAYKDTLSKSKAAETVGVTRQAVYLWLTEDPEFKEKFDDVIEGVLDTGESHLFKKVKDGHIDTIKYVISQYDKMKSRGWGVDANKVEVGGSVKLEVVRKIIPTTIVKTEVTKETQSGE